MCWINKFKLRQQLIIAEGNNEEKTKRRRIRGGRR